MKRIDWKKNKTLIVIGLVVIILVVLAVVFLLSSVSNKKDDELPEKKLGKEQTSIFYNEPYKDAEKITSKQLAKEHCLDDVCIKDLTIYYTEFSNNIELNIVNKGKDTKTGYLKIVFDDKAMTVAYKNLEKGKTSPYTIQLDKKRLTDTSDFTVRKLTKEELSKINKREK